MGALWAGLGGMGQASLISSALFGNGSSSSDGQSMSPQIYQGNSIKQGAEKTESNYAPASNQVDNMIPQSQGVNFSNANPNQNFSNIFEQEQLKKKVAGLL